MEFYQQNIKQALETLHTSEKGLTRHDAELRLDEYGKNALAIKGEPLWRKIAEPFLNVFTFVLFIAIAISVWHHAYIDAIVVGVIIIISAGIYYVQRFSTERILKTLRQQNTSSVQVLRDTLIETLPAELIVPGDIIVLSEGDKVPADARIITSANARVDESQLTGESLPIEKTVHALKEKRQIFEQSNMLFQGSFIISGEIRALVTATGNSTEFGTIASLTNSKRDASPVQKKIDKVITQTVIATALLSAIVLGVALLRGMELSEALRFVIALAVSAVPEGLPVAISVILALGLQRMAKKNALVRSMKAIETIGTITTIATDKTGTLTKNQLSIQKTWHPQDKLKELHKVASGAALISDKKIHDPLDSAIALFAGAHSAANAVTQLPFDQSLAMSGNVWHHGEKYISYLKGSPESIATYSKLSTIEREEITKKTEEFAKKGFRVIALAKIESHLAPQTLQEATEKSNLHFVGLLGIADTLRTEAKAAIERALDAGISVRMITGDHKDTAYNIGKSLGMANKPEQVIDAEEFSSISDAEARQRLENTKVFSRIIPEQKFRILKLLKKNNVTAMTGDGVNDVPALTQANVGIAMGDGSTIARDAGDIILLDNNFKTIVDAVAEGRRIFANIKSMLYYLLATSIGEVLTIVGALFLSIAAPFTALQILFINLATDTALVIPLGLEPGQKDDMKQPPHKYDAPLFERWMIIRMIIIALVMAAIALGFFVLYLPQGETYARTAAFISIVVAQWASAHASRDFHRYSWQIIRRPSKAYWVGLLLSLAMLLAVLFVPLLSEIFSVTQISSFHLFIVTIASVIVPLVASDASKYFVNKKQAS